MECETGKRGPLTYSSSLEGEVAAVPGSKMPTVGLDFARSVPRKDSRPRFVTPLYLPSPLLTKEGNQLRGRAR